MELRKVPPTSLGSGVNPTDPEKVKRIAASMRRHGWKDHRPLLVEEALWPPGLVAWTGTHRIAAAKVAKLAEVPCLVISRQTSQEALDRLADAVGYGSLHQALTSPLNGGGRYDRDRLRALIQLELSDVARALEEEIQSPAG